MPSRTPLTLAIAGTALLVHAVPAAGELLAYDRARVAAEPWRLLTGSLVHWSATHLALDLAAFVVPGAMVERRGTARLATLCGAALLLVGLAVHLGAPHLARYAGLSGLAFAVLAAAALDLAARGGAARRVATAALGVLVLKLVVDTLRPVPLLLEVEPDVVAAPASHLAGVLAALATVGVEQLAGRGRRCAAPGSAATP